MTSVRTRRNFLKLSTTLLIGAAVKPLPSLAKAIGPLKFIERAAFTMGSIATIKAYCSDEVLCSKAIDEAFTEMKTVDTLMSVFDKNSQLSLVNRHSAEKEVYVDTRIHEVLQHAKRYAELTNGAFDITVEPLMELYGFRDDEPSHQFPTDRQIADTLDAVGMDKVTVNSQPSTVNFEQAGTKLDFGGIAVGYAIDRAANILKFHGIESAIINHSGDIFALGSPPDEDGWEVGIIDPMKTNEIITRVRIKDKALSTSGNYENFIQADDKTIGHILNPSNGRTAETILSGTTIARTAIEADALSTGFFVIGIEKSRAISQRSRSLQFIAVVRDANGHNVIKM